MNTSGVVRVTISYTSSYVSVDVWNSLIGCVWNCRGASFCRWQWGDVTMFVPKCRNPSYCVFLRFYTLRPNAEFVDVLQATSQA